MHRRDSLASYELAAPAYGLWAALVESRAHQWALAAISERAGRNVLEVALTIRLPKRPGAMGRSRTILRAAARFDDAGREGRVAAFGKVASPGSSGGWVAHCHINEHADRGMMTFLELRY